MNRAPPASPRPLQELAKEDDGRRRTFSRSRPTRNVLRSGRFDGILKQLSNRVNLLKDPMGVKAGLRSDEEHGGKPRGPRRFHGSRRARCEHEKPRNLAHHLDPDLLNALTQGSGTLIPANTHQATHSNHPSPERPQVLQRGHGFAAGRGSKKIELRPRGIPHENEPVFKDEGWSGPSRDAG